MAHSFIPLHLYPCLSPPIFWLFNSTGQGWAWLAPGYALKHWHVCLGCQPCYPPLKACVPRACPCVASKQKDHLWTPETHRVPRGEKFKPQDSSAKEIKGNVLLKWVSSGALPRASAENFLTLKELSVHLSPTYIAHRVTANQHWAWFHLSVNNQKEVCIQNTFISLCTPASVTYCGPSYGISRLVIYNRIKWPIHFPVCKQTCQWSGFRQQPAMASRGSVRVGLVQLIIQKESF